MLDYFLAVRFDGVVNYGNRIELDALSAKRFKDYCIKYWLSVGKCSVKIKDEKFFIHINFYINAKMPIMSSPPTIAMIADKIISIKERILSVFGALVVSPLSIAYFALLFEKYANI